MIAEILGNPEVEHEQDESRAVLWVRLKAPDCNGETDGAYRSNPQETEPPTFEQGQTVELHGDFDQDQGYVEIECYRILKETPT